MVFYSFFYFSFNWIVYVNILQPGVGLKLDHVDMAAATEVTGKTQNLSFDNFVEHIVPKVSLKQWQPMRSYRS